MGSRQDVGSYWTLTRAKCIVLRRKLLKMASADSPMHRTRRTRRKRSKPDPIARHTNRCSKLGVHFKFIRQGAAQVKKKLLAGSKLQGSIRKPRKWPVERRVRRQTRAIFDENCSAAVNGVRTKELIPVSDCWQPCSRRSRSGNRRISPYNLAVCVLSVRIETHSPIG